MRRRNCSRSIGHDSLSPIGQFTLAIPGAVVLLLMKLFAVVAMTLVWAVSQVAAETPSVGRMGSELTIDTIEGYD